MKLQEESGDDAVRSTLIDASVRAERERLAEGGAADLDVSNIMSAVGHEELDGEWLITLRSLRTIASDDAAG